MTRSPIARRSNVLIGLAVGVAVAASPAIAEWPQWRGVDRDGRSAETGLLGAWPEGGPPLAFTATGLGGGYSSLAVTGGRIYTMGDLGDAQYAIALEDGTGKLLWKTQVGTAHKDRYLGPRSTPTVRGDRLWIVTTDGDVICLAAADGAVRWKRSLPGEWKGYMMKAGGGNYDWKFAESPLLDGNRVIVTPGHVEAVMVALDADTGKEIWRTAGTGLGPRGADGAAYSSAVIAEIGGVRQVVQLVGRGLIGVDAETGKLLWGWNRVANDVANISTPLVHGDFVLASTGYGAGTGLVRIAREGETWKADEVWFLEGDAMQNHHGGLILDGGTVFTGSGHNKGFPIATDWASGKVFWGPVRNKGERSAAVTYADGRLYFRYENGLMVLIEATTEAYREHGTFMIPDVSNFSWSHPVVSGGRLYLREQDALRVYDIRPAEKAPTGT